MKFLHALKNRYSSAVRIRLFGEFLTSITGAMLAPFLIIYLYDHLGKNVLLPMIIIGLQPLVEILFTIVGGGITDRFGRKAIILIALFLQTCSMTGFIFADSVWGFAAAYIVNGIGRALYIPASRAQIADSTTENRRSEVFAVINTIGSIGMTIGPVFGYLVFSYNPAFTFGLEAGALFIYFLVVWLKFPETAPLNQDPIDPPEDTGHPAKLKRHLSSRYSHVLGIMALSLPISFFYAQTETNYRVYIQDLFPDFLFVLTAMATCKAIMMIVLEIGLVKWTDRLSMKMIVMISYTGFGLAAVLYGYSTTLTLLIFSQLILTIAESIGLNHFLRFVSQLAPSNKRGLYFSLYGTHWDISRTIGPLLGGVFLIHFGGALLFYFAAFLLVIGGVGQFFFVKHIEGREKVKAAGKQVL